jgi:putative oxidoreductase
MNRRSMAEAWTPRLLSVMRALSGFLLFWHGTQKLFGFPAPRPMPIDFTSLLGLAAMLEFFGGLLLMLSLFTRPASFVLSGFMAVAYFMSRAAASGASTV